MPEHSDNTDKASALMKLRVQLGRQKTEKRMPSLTSAMGRIKEGEVKEHVVRKVSLGPREYRGSQLCKDLGQEGSRQTECKSQGLEAGMHLARLRTRRLCVAGR